MKSQSKIREGGACLILLSNVPGNLSAVHICTKARPCHAIAEQMYTCLKHPTAILFSSPYLLLHNPRPTRLRRRGGLRPHLQTIRPNVALMLQLLFPLILILLRLLDFRRFPPQLHFRRLFLFRLIPHAGFEGLRFRLRTVDYFVDQTAVLGGGRWCGGRLDVDYFAAAGEVGHAS